MDYEEIRPIVLESLKKKNETQVLMLIKDVGELAISKELYPATVREMPSEDKEKVGEIINDLVVEGIIGWGINVSNPGPPFIKVTIYGKECIENEGPQPYDPEGYIKYLKSEISNINDIILMYIEESLKAYLRGLYFSSTIMLGCASEKAVILLSEAYVNSLSDQEKKSTLENKFDVPIKKRMDLLRKELQDLKSQNKIPKEYSNDMETQIDGIFNFIRTCRNDVGHPSGRIIDRSLAYANLRLFVPYCKRIYDLINHFNTNTI